MAGRVQVADLAQPRLQPQAQPVDTYAPPARAPMDDNLNRLSQALAGFSTSVETYAKVDAIKTKAASNEALELDLTKMSGMTHEQIVEARKNGTLPVGEDHMQQASIDAVDGEVAGKALHDDIVSHFKTAYDPKVDGSPKEYVQKRQREAIEGMGDVKATNVLRQSNPAGDMAVGILQEKKDQKQVSDAHAASYNYLASLVQSGIKAGNDDDAIISMVDSNREGLKKSGFLGVDNQKIDDMSVANARDIVKDRPTLAIKMLNRERRAPDGTDITLAKNPRLMDQVQAVTQAANTQIDHNATMAWKGGMGDLGAKGIIDGNLDLVNTATPELQHTKADGSVLTMSPDEFKKEAVTSYINKTSPAIATQFKESPQQTLAREVNQLRKVGEQQPQVKAQVSGIFNSLSPATLQNPDAKEKLLGKLRTGQWLMNESQNTLQGYVTDEKDLTAISIYDVFKNHGVNEDGTTYSDEQAMTKAMEVSHPAIKATISFSRDDQDKTERRVKSLIENKGLLSYLPGNGSYSPQNFSAMQNKVEYLARGFIASGVAHDKAIDMAADAVQKTTLVYNGVIIPKVNGFMADDDFGTTAKSYIDDWARKNPKTLKALDITTNDIALAPMGDPNGNSGGHFRLIIADGQTDVLDDNHNQVIFDANALRNKQARDKSKRVKSALTRAANY